jgi:hypothetical protein
MLGSHPDELCETLATLEGHLIVLEVHLPVHHVQHATTDVWAEASRVVPLSDAPSHSGSLQNPERGSIVSRGESGKAGLGGRAAGGGGRLAALKAPLLAPEMLFQARLIVSRAEYPINAWHQRRSVGRGLGGGTVCLCEALEAVHIDVTAAQVEVLHLWPKGSLSRRMRSMRSMRSM